MMNRLDNMKWRIPVFLLIATTVTIMLGIAGWNYIDRQNALSQSTLRILLIVVLMVANLFAGYEIILIYQRKWDILHLAIKQLGKGNLRTRIHVAETDNFDELYEDFNDMAEWMEGKVRLLQQLGEESVGLQMRSNEAAVMDERKRLARDLHDSVSQQLFAIHMSSASMQKMLNDYPQSVQTIVEQLVVMSQSAQKQLRGLIAQLRPLELEGKTLIDALDQWFPVYCNQNGLQGILEVQCQGELSEVLEHQLFLIIQEGMANIVKHAHAAHVTLGLYETNRQYLLQIIDDGQGFKMQQEQIKSYGLASMQERAQKLGGNAEIISRSGEGTSIKVNIPKFI